MELELKSVNGGVRLQVQIQPKAKKDEIAGVINGRLKIRLTAPPVEGQANKALVAFLAKRLKLAKSKIRIVAGIKSRQKELIIAEVSEDEIRRLAGGPETNASG